MKPEKSQAHTKQVSQIGREILDFRGLKDRV